jgi:hypothetical protein
MLSRMAFQRRLETGLPSLGEAIGYSISVFFQGLSRADGPRKAVAEVAGAEGFAGAAHDVHYGGLFRELIDAWGPDRDGLHELGWAGASSDVNTASRAIRSGSLLDMVTVPTVDAGKGVPCPLDHRSAGGGFLYHSLN